MKKILTSILTLTVVGLVAYAGTSAFFSDTETSVGNTFAAGAIDLLVGNESYVTDVNGNLVTSSETSWTLDDLTGKVFFNFFDLKPGDIGEDTITLQVNDNDAYVCAAAQVTEDNDASYTEPELVDDNTVDENAPSETDGELAEQLYFAFWADDGDNVFETSEQIFVEGPASNLNEVGSIALADSQTNVWGDVGALPGATERYIGKAWCFGTLTPNDTADESDTGPLDRGTGFDCDGTAVDNAAQTDVVGGDLQFYAVQARNNDGFTCDADYVPDFPTEEREQVGAVLGGYVAPTECTTTLSHADNLQATIDAATNGSTICLQDGEYNEFTVDRPLTIAGLTNPNMGSAKIVPSNAGVTELALVLSSNVTLTGLHFDGSGTLFTGNQMAGVQVSPSGANVDNVNVVYNIIENLNTDAGNTTASNKGIQWFSETPSTYGLTNSAFMHNEIMNVNSTSKGSYGIQTVGPMTNVMISNNTIADIDGAWEAGISLDAKDSVITTGVSVDHNHIMSGIGTFSVQVEANVDGAGIAININNLETLLYGGSSGNSSAATLNAEDNWWGTASPSVGTDVIVAPATNTVDFLPFEIVAYAN